MTIQFDKNNPIGLADEVNGETVAVNKLTVGLAWDVSGGQQGRKGGLLGRAKKKFKEEMGGDLDLIAVLMQGDRPVRYAGWDNNDPWRGSIIHTGDETSGKADGDDEQVICELNQINSPVDGIVFVAGALKENTSFKQVQNVEMNIYTKGNPSPDTTYLPSLLETSQAVAMAIATKQDGFWRMDVLDQPLRVAQGDLDSVLRACQGLRSQAGV